MSGCIPVTLWGEFTESLEEGKAYIIRNLRVETDYVTKELCLNTAESGCTAKETEAFNDPLPELPILPSLGMAEKM